MKFEYKVIHIEDSKGFKDEVMESIQEQFNKLGMDRWQLINSNITITTVGDKPKLHVVSVFKRPIK